MSKEAPIRIERLESPPGPDALELLQETLGSTRDASWFAWKHLENPAGPTCAWIARDEEGPVGLRLFMRWRLSLGGRPLRALRPVDTVTAPRARRRGVFRALTEHALQELETETSYDLFFNNPNSRSRPGYLSMGWAALPPLRRGLLPLLPGRTAGLEHQGVTELIAQAPAPRERLATVRDLDYLSWRYERGPAMEYGFARLAQSDRPSAMIYRVARVRGVRTLLVLEISGSAPESRLLLRSVGRLESAPAALLASGIGSYPAPRTWLRRRGAHLVVRQRSEAASEALDIETWALSLGDVEGVI